MAEDMQIITSVQYITYLILGGNPSCKYTSNLNLHLDSG